MPRGHYDRTAARAKRVSLAPVEAPPSPLDLGEAPEDTCEPRQSGPVRLVQAHGYREARFNRGVFHWAAGEIITNPDEIAHLIERGAKLEPVACPEAPHSAQTP